MRRALVLISAGLLTACTAQPAAVSASCEALYSSCCNVCRALPPPVPAACWAGCMTAYAACLAKEG